MRVNKNLVWKNIEAIRETQIQDEDKKGLSYASMAKLLTDNGCPTSSWVLYDCLNGKDQERLPQTDFIILCKELWGYTPDNLLFGANIDIVDDIQNRYSALKKDGNLEPFLDECWLTADLASGDINEEDDSDYSEFYIYYRRFKEVREHSGKTADDIAKLMGCHRSTIFRNEFYNRKRLPTLRYLFNFCNMLDASADYILFGEFLGLSSDILPILDGFSYGTQIDLMKKFLSISEKYL